MFYMMYKLFVIYLLSGMCRIIPSGSSRNHIATPDDISAELPINPHSHGGVRTAKHVHLHKNKKKHRPGHGHKGHAASHKRPRAESPTHDVMLKNMVENTGAPNEGGLTDRELDLAHSGAHGDAKSIQQLKDDGVLSPDLANDLINRQADKESRSAAPGEHTPAQLLQALNSTPHNSAPLQYTPMRMVRKGEDPQLERDLDIQKTMKSFRSSLPTANTNTNSLLDNAENILRSAPDGYLDSPYPDKYGRPTNRTYREAAADYVNANRPQIMEQVDEMLFGSERNPAEMAEREYTNMVNSGIPPEQAKKIADEIETHGYEDLNKHGKLSDSIKRNLARGIQQRAVENLQDEIQKQKLLEGENDRSKVENEIIKQHTVPNINPLGIYEEDIGLIKGTRDTVPVKKLAEYMDDAYQNSLEAGLPPDIARAQANRTGGLISDFNSMLRGGESVETALSHLKDNSDRLNKVDQRRELLQNSSPEIIDLITKKDELVKQALVRMAKKPDCRDKIFDELSQEMKKLDADQSALLHERENIKHIRTPKNMAEEIIDKTNKEHEDLVDLAYSSPIVTKNILQRGIQNVEKVAETLTDHLDAVNYQEQKHNPTAVSALKLLDDKNREDELEKINRKNAEEEQKIYKEILKDQEDLEVMKTEEKIAAINKAKKIIEEGIRAAEDVIKSGGTVEEANAVKASIENATAKAIENREAAVEEEIMKKLGGSGNPDKARRMAAHIAIAHSGDNAVGKTRDEVLKREQELEKKEILNNALYNDVSGENVEIKSVIPEKAKEVSIDRSVIKFPLKTFIDEEAKNVGEDFVKNKKQALNEEVRNKITKTKVNSGLNVIETEDGFLNMGENSEKITIEKGTAFFSPAAKLKMEKKGIKTDHFVPKHNQGEISDLPKGETYYEVELKDMSLNVPSPTNPTPNTLLSNGSEALDVEDVSAIVVKKGKLIQTPWAEYSDMVKPKFNPSLNESEKIEEIRKLHKHLADEKAKETLDRIKVNTITNPDGEKHLEIKTSFGVPEILKEEEAIMRLEHFDADKNVAVSETPTEDKKETLINNLSNVPDSRMIDQFIEDVFNEAYSSRQASRFVNPRNAFTGQEDPRKTNLTKKEAIDIGKYLINDNKPSSAVKNALIQNSKALGELVEMEEEEFIEMVNKIPDSSIAEMIAYNEQSESTRPELVDAPFFKTLQPLGNDVHLHDLISVIFTQVAKVTGKPNTSTSKTLEQKIVPNLKAVKTEQNVNLLGGKPSILSQATAPKKGTTVLSKQVTKGPPRVPSGETSSYPVRSPITPNNKQQNARTKVNPKNPYSKVDRSFNTPNNQSTAVNNGSRPSPYSIRGNPIRAAVSSPVTLPPNTVPNKGRPVSQGSTSSLKGATPVTRAGRINAGVAGQAGINPAPTGGARVGPRPPAPPSGIASPTSPAPSPRLGIASSPQK